RRLHRDRPPSVGGDHRARPVRRAGDPRRPPWAARWRGRDGAALEPAVRPARDHGRSARRDDHRPDVTPRPGPAVREPAPREPARGDPLRAGRVALGRARLARRARMSSFVGRIRRIPSWQVTLGVALLLLGFLVAAQLAAEGPRIRYASQERTGLVDTAQSL